MNNNKQNIIKGNITFNGDSNQTIIKQNKQHQIDKSNNKSSKVTKVYKMPKRITEKELEQLKKITMRPNLKDKEGKFIRCFGYNVGLYGDMDDRYTIINVIDIDGSVYTADHIQLDYKSNFYDYSNDIGQFIYFEGFVKSYPKNGSCDYTIDITSKVESYSSNFICCRNLEEYNENFDYNYIRRYLSKSNMTKIYDLIEFIRNDINEITGELFTEDFIYYYIISQFFLNQATYHIYEGKLRDQGFPGNVIIKIMVIMANVLYDLNCYHSISLEYVLSLIAQCCNIIQGVKSYNKITDEFRNFVKECVGKDIGSKKIKSMWSFTCHRQENFNHETPNDLELSEQDLIERMYYVINNYIK